MRNMSIFLAVRAGTEKANTEINVPDFKKWGQISIREDTQAVIWLHLLFSCLTSKFMFSPFSENRFKVPSRVGSGPVCK